MKKIISLVLALVLICLSVASCGKKGNKAYNYDLSEYITLPEYKKIPIKAENPEFSEEYFRMMISSVVNSYSRKIEITDRPVQIGDLVTVSYNGYVEGMMDEPVVKENVEMRVGMGSSEDEVGIGTMPEEFDNAVIGLNTGEWTTISITLPDPFPDYPDYAGKTAEFTIVVSLICETEAPVYNDDFVRAYLKHDSVEEYENYVREKLIKERTDNFNQSVSTQLWQIILNGTEVKKYPDAEVKAYYDEYIGTVKEYVDAIGGDYAAFIEANFEMTEDEFHDFALEQSRSTVKEEMIANAIARAENIEFTEKEYNTRALEYANLYGLNTVEEFEKQFSREKIEQLILTDLVSEYLIDAADITFVEGAE